MLLLSAVLVYIVSFIGVRSGKLKKDISWEHPIFVSLFTHELNESADGTGADSVKNGVSGKNNGQNPPDIPVQTWKSADDDKDCDFTQREDTALGNNDGTKADDSDNDKAQRESADTQESQNAEENGSTQETVSSEAQIQPTDDTDTSGTDNNSGGVTDSAYSGQVVYVKTDMRHARSGYYSDFDTIALSSELDYVHVDNDYFSNACFIGDSRMEGLYFYGDLREADYYYKPGVTVYDIMDRKLLCNGDGGDEITNYLSRKQYAHIYMMVGVNELGDKNPEEYAKAYSDDIERIKQLQPDAVIFIIGMMHVTTAYSNESDVFNNDNIDARNTAVAAIANGKDIFYLDMNECVDDGSGGVIGDYSYDGVHLKAEYYKLWTEWMKAHGVKNLIK